MLGPSAELGWNPATVSVDAAKRNDFLEQHRCYRASGFRSGVSSLSDSVGDQANRYSSWPRAPKATWTRKRACQNDHVLPVHPTIMKTKTIHPTNHPTCGTERSIGLPSRFLACMITQGCHCASTSQRPNSRKHISLLSFSSHA